MRSKRTRSKLFPAGGQQVFAGSTYDLADQQSHASGTRISAGKLIVPSDAEKGQTRAEFGPADFRGVELVGINNAGLVSTKEGTVTAPAGILPGDLLLLFSAQKEGTANALVPQAGWTNVTNGATFYKFQQNLLVWTRHVGINEPSAYSFYTEQSTDDAYVAIVALRNADWYGEDLDWEVTLGSVTSTTGALPAMSDIDKGSLSLAVAGWYTTGTAATTTFPSGYTEILDASAVGASEKVGLAIAHFYREGSEAVGADTVTFSQSVVSDVAHLIIKPFQQAIRVWTGEDGSDTFSVNERGRAHIKEIVSDVDIRGFVRSKAHAGIIPKAANQSFTAGTPAQITFAVPDLDMSRLWDNSGDAVVFYDHRDRGLWAVTLFVKWAGNTDTTRRKIWISELSDGSLENAMSNVRAPGVGNCTQEVTLYYIYDGSKSFDLLFFAESEVTLNMEGGDEQNSTHIKYQYLGDVE